MSTGSRPRIVTQPPRRPLPAVLWAVAGLALGAMLSVLIMRSDPAEPSTQDLAALLSRAEADSELLQRRLAQLQRGQQVTDAANHELRQRLIEAENLQAELREEIAFYRRLLDVGGEIRGLDVHDLTLRATGSDQVVSYRLVLSQNLNKAAVIRGRYRIEVSGVARDAAATLGPEALGLDPGALQFEFKYYQLLRGTLHLPEGFQPLEVTVRVSREDRKAPVVRSYEWKIVPT